MVCKWIAIIIGDCSLNSLSKYDSLINVSLACTLAVGDADDPRSGPGESSLVFSTVFKETSQRSGLKSWGLKRERARRPSVSSNGVVYLTLAV